MSVEAQSHEESRRIQQHVSDLARNIDEQGRQVWRRNGSEVKSAARELGYYIAIGINIALLYVAHNLLGWNIPFVTEDWTSVLWIVDISLGANILANALYLFYDAPWFKRLSHIGLNAVQLLSTYVMYRVFPFDFGLTTLNEIVSLVMLVAMIVLVVAMVVESIVLAVKGNK